MNNMSQMAGMSQMDAMTFLNMPRNIQNLIEQKLRRAEDLRSLARSSTVNLQKVFTKGGKVDERLQDMVTEALSMEEEARDLMLIKIDAEREVLEVIHRLHHIKMEEIFRMRYLEECSWESISRSTLTDIRWIHRQHKRGLGLIQRILDTMEGEVGQCLQEAQKLG